MPTRTHHRTTGTSPEWFYLLALTAISAVSRLPQLRSPNLLLDGDECTVGLMALHVAKGHEFPLFFWGQHYGFAPIETVVSALSLVTFGAGAVQMKAAMLALWTVGVLCLFFAQAKLVGSYRSFWIAATLVLLPAWAVPSMTAWSGYITAFTATGALLWLLMCELERTSMMRWLIAGALTSIIYLAQPLWLPGILPPVLAVLVFRRRPSSALLYLAVTGLTLAFVRTSGYSAGNPDPLASVPDLAHEVYVSLTGAYYLWRDINPPGTATKILAVVWCGALIVAAIIQLGRVVTRRFYLPSHLLFLSVCSTLIAECVLLTRRDPRYLLPLPALLVLLAGIEVVDLLNRRVLPKRLVVGLTAGVLLLGAVSMGEFRAFNFLWNNPPTSWSENKRMQQVVALLNVRGVHHVFAMNAFLQWQVSFYSDEHVVARFMRSWDRYPPYVAEVDRAVADGEPIAVVGYTDDSGAPGCWDVPICTGGIERLVTDPQSIYKVDGKYFVYAGADRSLLEKLNFRFPDE
jgi:4-amino-4-deoxy-L-arabinose transferase-like glycosyltransferase